MLLEAVTLGLGSVWLGVAPLKERMDFIQSFFQLPENMIPFTIIPVGYPAEELTAGNRFKKNRIYSEKFS